MGKQSFQYSGSELDLFSEAIQWRTYWSSQIRAYLGRQVLEVGAGIGSTTQHLCKEHQDSWLALEPDPDMAARLSRQTVTGMLPGFCKVECGTLQTLSVREGFDTILYIDVLEHIENDFSEIQDAAKLLKSGGFLVVLAPAHQWLYTPFDEAIGHYRRYTRKSLSSLTPSGLRRVDVKYLDSVGLIASLGNRLLLKTAYPTRNQILLWDRYMVRLSKLLDPILFHRVGKSILVVWQRY